MMPTVQSLNDVAGYCCRCFQASTAATTTTGLIGHLLENNETQHQNFYHYGLIST